MQTVTEKWLEQIMKANGGNFLWLLGLLALVLLFVFAKAYRKTLVLPAVLLSVLIYNPLTYYLTGRLHLAYVYWRFFWMVPLVPLLAAAGVLLAGRVKEGVARILVTLLAVCCIVLFGRSVYANMPFERLGNPYRIPQLAAMVGDALLQLDDEPHVLATPYLSTSLRQYSTDIHQLYGRDYYGYIGQADEATLKAGEEVHAEAPDLAFLYELMAKRDVDYLVRVRLETDSEATFAAAGFEKVAEVERYDIYRRI